MDLKWKEYQHITRRSLVELRRQNPQVPWVRKRFRIHRRWTRVLPAKRSGESAWSLSILPRGTPQRIRLGWTFWRARPTRNAHGHLCRVRCRDASPILAQEWPPRLLQPLLWQSSSRPQLTPACFSRRHKREGPRLVREPKPRTRHCFTTKTRQNQKARQRSVLRLALVLGASDLLLEMLRPLFHWDRAAWQGFFHLYAWSLLAPQAA